MSAISLYSGASANNGATKYEFEGNSPDIYVTCLGEHISAHLMFTVVDHRFVTPSGKHHIMEHWQYIWEITGVLSGRTWFARGASTGTINVGPGETAQWGENFVAIPITGDGPKIRFHYRFKATVNANGELVVPIRDLAGIPPEDWYECIGKH